MFSLFRRIGISGRIGGGLGLAVITTLLLVGPALFMVIDELIDRAIDRDISAHLDLFRETVDAESSRAASLARLVAAMPEVVTAMGVGDRETLSRAFVPAYKALATTEVFEQMQFHLPPAISFLRVHQPAKFGDETMVTNTAEVTAALSGRTSPRQGLCGGGWRGEGAVRSDQPGRG